MFILLIFFIFFFFFFNDTATTEIYTLSLHDALPICLHPGRAGDRLRSAHLPGARHRRVGDLGGLAVQPPGARLVRAAVVPVAALHRLPVAAAAAARGARHQRPPVAQDRRTVLTREDDDNAEAIPRRAGA